MVDTCALSCSKVDKLARCIAYAKDDFEGRKGLKAIKLEHKQSAKWKDGSLKKDGTTCTAAEERKILDQTSAMESIIKTALKRWGQDAALQKKWFGVSTAHSDQNVKLRF